MARIQLGPLVQDISGKLGNQIFSKWKSGVHYVRTLPTAITNPNSAAQALIRDNVSALSKYWNDTLTGNERGLWETFALSLPDQVPSTGGIFNIIPDSLKGKQSGFNAFLAVNLLGVSAGFSVFLDAAPVGLTGPNGVTDVGSVASGGSVFLTWTEPSVMASGAVARIWGRSREDMFHKQLIDTVPASAEAYEVDTMRGALGTDFALTPGHYIFQIDVVNTLAGGYLKSNPSETVFGAIPLP